jgi:hypothetical protein
LLPKVGHDDRCQRRGGGNGFQPVGKGLHTPKLDPNGSSGTRKVRN